MAKAKKTKKTKETKKKSEKTTCLTCCFYYKQGSLLRDFCTRHQEIRPVLIKKKILSSLDDKCNKFHAKMW